MRLTKQLTRKNSHAQVLERLGLSTSGNSGVFDGKWHGSGHGLTSRNPCTNEVLATATSATAAEYDAAVDAAVAAQREWAAVPAPKRGEVVRQIGDALRANLDDLGAVVALEVGKVRAEGVGEVQEFVDICDYAAGLSRMYGGPVLPSERPDHYMAEQWHPLGAVGVISAFNFPVAVYGWNAAIALITGNAVVWKGAPSVSMSTLATARIMADVLERNGHPGALVATVLGDRDIGERMTSDSRLPLLSFTGSCEVGRLISERVAARDGLSLLELGGNNACTVMDDANLDLALRGVVFAAVGTAGQRCTTTRRLFLHEKIADEFMGRLADAYGRVTIGDPLEDGVLCGPLHSQEGVERFRAAVQAAVEQGGEVVAGGRVLDGRPGNFVEPTVIRIRHDAPVVHTETFAPIVYVDTFTDLDDAIARNNAVPQGLSSSLFTTSPATAMRFGGALGSDCGIVNVNLGTSGAEIGGAFGGNKATGWGRESGSDAWKQYCRRSTFTFNHGTELPLAQGIQWG